MKPRPVVGQTLYALNVGNNARHQAQVLRPVQVISVGRKYFKAIPPEYSKSPHMAVEYELENWGHRSECSINWRLYATAQEWEDEKEMDRMSEDLRKMFSGYGRIRPSLEALRIAHGALIATPQPAKESDHGK
jgi:hypothetical protein